MGCCFQQKTCIISEARASKKFGEALVPPFPSLSPPLPFLSYPPFTSPPLKQEGVWGDMSPHSGSGAKLQPPNVFLGAQASAGGSIFGASMQIKAKINQFPRIF